MKRQLVILVFIGLLTHISCNTQSDKESTKAEFKKMNLNLTDNFEINNFKISGLTDYALDIEIKVDSFNIQMISKFIEDKSGFFCGDTTTNIGLFNNYPYLKDNKMYWEEYIPAKSSYKYRRIEADLNTRIVKYHYLDEE